ncbi:mavicyanin [Elaeis guineensis]|uniref:Mavicyanin n=1 Tax=Elaeis guineensis var. tenera TaxID=51953 RepID=A0A6I9SN39_ELAGV|nr:mavicyanin [Elaeis guineensis]
MAGCTSIALAALLLMSCATWGSATKYTVGDSSGWTTNVNYNTWTSGKDFIVGDSLLFNFATGAHTVTGVSSSDYNSCSSSNAISSVTNGPATIELNTTGTRYYICAIAGHCNLGMKLEVTVRSSSPGSPSTPPPPPSSTTPTASPPPPTTTGNNSAAPAGLVPASAMVSLTGLVVLLF